MANQNFFLKKLYARSQAWNLSQIKRSDIQDHQKPAPLLSNSRAPEKTELLLDEDSAGGEREGVFGGKLK